MGVWCHIEGTVLIRKGKNISIKKMVRDILDGHDYTVDTSTIDKYASYWEHWVSISIEAENSQAFKWCEELCVLMSKQAHTVDLVVSVRWVK